MKRLGRYRFVVYALLALLLLLGGARLYLSSSFAASKVAAQLSSLFGVPVRVDSVDIGFRRGSTVKGMQILEANPVERLPPWLIAQNLVADVSVVDILQGNPTPREVRLAGAAIALHFDKDGNLLTRLPKPSGGPFQTLPKLRIEDGKVTLSQEGHDHPFIVQNVAGTGESAGRVLTVEGTVRDSYWGDWTFTGRFDLDAARFMLRLHTDRADVTLEKLERLPFVSAGVWEEVRIEAGETPVDFTLTVQSDIPTTSYRIELQPHVTRLHIASIDLDVQEAHGKVVVENNLVELRDVKGRTAQGTVSTQADLDFRAESSRLDFNSIQLDGVDLQSLPDSWKLKQYEFSGKVTGKASLAVVVKPAGKGVETHGSGEGLIADAYFRRLPLSEPVKLTLNSEGSKFRIAPPQKARSQLPGAAGSASQVGESAATRFATATGEAVPIVLVGLIVPPLPASKQVEELMGNGASAAARGAAAVPRETISAVTSAASALGRVLNQSGPNPGEEPSYLDAELSLKDVDLRQTVERLGLDLPFPVAGRLTLWVKLGVPIDTPSDLKTYRMSGTADLSTFSIAGLDITNVHVGVRLDNGVLRLEELKADLAGAPLTGRAELRLDGDYPFKGKVDLARFDLETLRRLTPHFRPPFAVLEGNLSVSADVKGELRTRKLTASGTARAADLLFEKARIDAVAFKWEAGTERLRLFDLQAKLYEGEVIGSAVLPLRDAVEGNVDVRIRAVNAQALMQAIPAIPLRLEGRVSGSVAATLPAAADKSRAVSARIELEAPRLKVQNIPAQRLHGSVTYRAGRADYRLEGETLGGTFKLEGRIPPAKPEAERSEPEEQETRQPAEEPDGRLTVEGVRLSRLGETLGRPDALGPLRGRLSATLAYRHGGLDRWPIGTGRLRISDLHWGDRAIAEDIAADLRLTERALQVRDISGQFGEGVLRGLVVLNLRERERSHFTLSLERADASRILAPFPALADLVEGPVEVNLRGTLGREWSASGSMVLSRGRVLGMGVSEWRMPVSFSFSPTEEHGQFAIHDSVAQIASGRATGGVRLSWGDGTRVEGAFRFFNADFQGLAARSASLRTVAIGKVTGRFEFSASDLRTVDDLNGVLEARLAQSQALELPVLNDLVPFILPGQSSTTFQSGDVRARLSRGAFHLQRLALMSPAVRLVLTGDVRLNGRLDLDATAQTGDVGVNTTGLRLLAQRVPAVGTIPVSLISQASALLANRVIHLRVTGTVRSPVVRIDPISLLSEEAVRLLLTRYLLPLPAASSLP